MGHSMKIGFLLPLILVWVVDCRAQEDVFAADRPGLSDAPDLIKPGGWQIASGFDISRYSHTGNYQLSENTLKYGLSKYFEARLDFGLQYDPAKRIYGSSGPSLGIKALLCNQHGAIPKTAFIAEYYPPAFSSLQASSGLATEFCFSHTFTSGNSLYYNAGANWQDITKKASLNSLIGYSYSVNGKINCFAEFYLFKSPERPTNYVSDFGCTYLVSKKLLLDISSGINLTHPKGNFYYSGGITYNF